MKKNLGPFSAVGATGIRGVPIVTAPSPAEAPAAETAPSFDGDLRLMLRVAAGERAAQRALAARLSGRVRRVARTLLRDPADADDAAQAALLDILKSAGNYKALGPLERWADRIVVHAASLLARQRRRSLERIDHDASLDDIAELETEPLSTDELARPMTEYLDRIPEPIRMALVLRHTLGYSLDEIGVALEITANAAKKRVSRGHQAIRRMIRKDRVVGLHVGGKS